MLIVSKQLMLQKRAIYLWKDNLIYLFQKEKASSCAAILQGTRVKQGTLTIIGRCRFSKMQGLQCILQKLFLQPLNPIDLDTSRGIPNEGSIFNPRTDKSRVYRQSGIRVFE